MFDSKEQIIAKADRINARAVVAKDMPPIEAHAHDDGTVEDHHHDESSMTDKDREQLGLWIKQGAKN